MISKRAFFSGPYPEKAPSSMKDLTEMTFRVEKKP
jgi:hypothetical protein